MKIRTLLMAMGGLAVATGAHAQTVDVQSPLQGPGKNVRVTTPAGTSTLFAGQLTHSFSNASGEDSWLNGPRVTYTLLPTPTPVSGSLECAITSIASLSANDPFAGAKAAAIEQYFNNAQYLATDPASSQDFSACFQLLIWETMYDYNPSIGGASLSLTSGSFSATKSTGAPLSTTFLGVFNSFVGGLNALPDTGYRVAALDSDCGPDYIASRQIPAPGGAVVLALAGLGAARRRR